MQEMKCAVHVQQLIRCGQCRQIKAIYTRLLTYKFGLKKPAGHVPPFALTKSWFPDGFPRVFHASGRAVTIPAGFFNMFRFGHDEMQLSYFANISQNDISCQKIRVGPNLSDGGRSPGWL